MADWIRVVENSVVTVSVTPAEGQRFKLEELQRMVGGYIEALYFDDGRIMWLNEEGKLNGLPYNPVADLMAHEHTGIAPHDSIVGNVVITSLAESGEEDEEEDQE